MTARGLGKLLCISNLGASGFGLHGVVIHE